MSSVESKVTEILARSGIGAKLAHEAEVQRAAQHAACRARKKAAIAKYFRDKVPAEALVKSIDDKAIAAQKAAELALDDYLRARASLDAVRDTMTAITEPAEREMLGCYDLRIDAFIAELIELRAATPALARTWPDPEGRLRLSNGQHASDNSVLISARITAINLAIDCANRLKINEAVDDIPAELSRLRNSLPSA